MEDRLPQCQGFGGDAQVRRRRRAAPRRRPRLWPAAAKAARRRRRRRQAGLHLGRRGAGFLRRRAGPRNLRRRSVGHREPARVDARRDGVIKLTGGIQRHREQLLSTAIDVDGASDRRQHLWRGTIDKRVAALLGAAATLATVGGANATDVQGNVSNPTANYRDLLNPVPNALEALKADDARLANTPADGG